MTLQIDYKNEVLYGLLQRMAPSVGDISPILQEYWVCSIDPKNSPKLLGLIKSQFQHTVDGLQHLKRIHKENDGKGNLVLKVLLCPVQSKEFSITKEALLSMLIGATHQDNITLEVKSIPMNKPLDKETNIKWSKEYWPLLWKGNPVVQDLNEIYKGLDINKISKYMKRIAELSKQQVCNNYNKNIFHKTDLLTAIKLFF